MKCDELMKYGMNDPTIGDDYEMYRVADVDAAIAELKSENERLNRELEHVKNGDCINTCDVVEKHVKEEIKAKRALWLARAERADDRARIFYFNDLETKLDIDGYSYDRKKKKGHKKLTARLWRIIWLKVERKCRAKAEKYK